MNKLIATLLVTSTTIATADTLPQASAAQLNSKHHVFRVQSPAFAGYLPAANIPPISIVVGGTTTLAVPAVLGVGMGPFARVYPEHSSLSATAPDTLAIERTSEGFAVTCKRAGIVELELAADQKCFHVSDTIDVACVAPTRFTATDRAHGHYLAGLSLITYNLEWYGQRDGHEIPLLGSLPVTTAPNETAVTAVSSTATEFATLQAVHAATALSLVSAGITLQQPVDIVDTSDWKLELGARHTSVWARIVDASGRPFDGSYKCEMTTYRGGQSATQPNCSVGRADRFDRVCFTVHGQTACTKK